MDIKNELTSTKHYLYSVLENKSSLDIDYYDKKIKAYFSKGTSIAEIQKLVKQELNLDLTEDEMLRIFKIYEKNNEEWIFSENSFCFIAYIYTLFYSLIELFDAFFKIETKMKMLSCLFILAFLIIVNTFFQSKKSKWGIKRKIINYVNNLSDNTFKKKIELLFYISNRYLPSITIIINFFVVFLQFLFLTGDEVKALFGLIILVLNIFAVGLIRNKYKQQKIFL